MKARVPLWSTPQKYATLDTEATKGAVLGVNLYNPDGSLVSLQTIAQSVTVLQSSVNGTPGGGGPTGDLTTDLVSEGSTNLYFTTARAQAALLGQLLQLNSRISAITQQVAQAAAVDQLQNVLYAEAFGS